MHSLTETAIAEPTSLRAQAPPDKGQAIYVQGLQALRDGKADVAVSLLTQALRWQPTHFAMRRNLVRALLISEAFEQVVVQANAALSGMPDDAELHFARGTALNALGHHAQACAALARALSLQPDHAPSWLNMGNASTDLDDLTSAETLYRSAIRVDSTLAEAHASLGYVLTRQGRLNEAITACETATGMRPDFAQAHWNLAFATLLTGDLQRGFVEYEWRKRHTRHGADFPVLPGRVWDGTDAGGQTILVRGEQGFGDVIQFARYLPLIRDMGGSPILMCAATLVPLVASMPGIRVVSSSDALPAYDSWIDQLSLPRVFGTSLHTIPAPDAYLSVDPIRVRAWRARLQDGDQPGEIRRIGVAFAGNPRHRSDQRRSIPAGFDLNLPDLPNLNYVSLQYGHAAGLPGVNDLTLWMSDYAETAALIDTLDLVITVDTSVAHVAGALGKPVWILLPHAPDWRWLLGRSDSPWYRSARLFRQPTPGDWTSVLAEVAQALTLAC
jgi:tetratricopeptide (TPR) repeat protein